MHGKCFASILQNTPNCLTERQRFDCLWILYFEAGYLWVARLSILVHTQSLWRSLSCFQFWSDLYLVLTIHAELMALFRNYNV